MIGPCPAEDDAAFELRAFFGSGAALREDPVTGSLNAAAAQWLIGSGRVAAPYVARQGTAIGRDGRIHVVADADELWIGGHTYVAISGTVELG